MKLALKSWPHRGTSRSLVYRVFKKSHSEFIQRILVLAMKVWAKECCIEQFQFRLCEKIYQIIAKNWLKFWYILTQLLVKNGCISWAKALHFKPVSGTLYKLTEKVLNCCIWSQKIGLGIGSPETHCSMCAETLKWCAIVVWACFMKILTSAGTISIHARTATTALRSVYWAKRTSFEAVSLCLLCQFCLKLVLKSWLKVGSEVEF